MTPFLRWVNVTPNYNPTLSTVADQIVSTGDAVDVSSTANEVYFNEVYEGYVDWGDGTGLHPTGFTDEGSSATLKAHLDAAGDPGQYAASLLLCSVDEPNRHSGVEDTASFNVSVAGSPLLIDANNDDGLDVPTLDNTPESEQQTFGDTTQPGKLISVNAGDKDGDGIPDYADGYNLFTDQSDSANPPTSDQGAGFVPITVQIPSWIDPANLQLTFTYSASDPNLVTRSGSGTDDDPYTYSPADGSLRLWIKDEATQRNPASVGDGGDWIKPDESFPASDLNGTTTIYVEAVRPSTDLADDAITLTFSGSHLPPDPTGTVHLTAFGMQYDQVNSDGTIAPATQPEVSQPSPIIDLTDYQLENVHFSSDFTQIIANIHLAGTVTDAASDLIAGADGTIHTIDVTLNGGNTSLAMIDLEVTKSDGSDSLLHPYAYSGSFDQTLRGVMVDPGWNLIHLSAANLYGYSGYAEASMEVDVNPDNTDISLSQDPYTADADAQITITYTRDGQLTTDTLKQDPNQPDLWINIADTITLDTSRAGGGNETLHLTDTTRKIDDDIVFSQDTSGVMRGTFVPDPETQDDYRNMTVAAGAVTDVTASTGGILSPLALEVLGPADLQNILEKATFNNQDFRIITYDDKNFLQPWEAKFSVPGLNLAMLDTSPSTDPVLASLNNPPRQDGLANFAKGFGVGVIDAGVSLWDGAKSMGKAVWNSTPPVFIYHLFNGQITKQARQGIQNLKAIAGVAEVLYQAVKQNSQQVITDIMLGNNSVINSLGEQYIKAFQAEAELFQQIGKWFENLDDYTFGKILGRITGEALVLVLTEGAGQIAELSKAALLQKLLPRLLKVEELAPRTVELTQYVEKSVEGLKTTKMCFVAGTLVHTDQGLKPIETIKAGDLVLSRNEQTSRQKYKPVIQTMVTHPTRLYHVIFRTQTGKEESLVCTGEHPFHVAVRGDFVAARELQPGEVLTLAEGSSAQILSITTEDALDRAFTTYNFEVADFHTYFAGRSGVWVHNVGGMCEKFYSLFQFVKNGDELTTWQAVKRVMKETAAYSKQMDSGLTDFATSAFKQIYKEAGGDYRKVPTIKEVFETMGAHWDPTAFGGKGGWVGSRAALVRMQNHHTAVIHWTEELLGRSLTQAEKDAMPAFLLDEMDHVQHPTSFHAILDSIMRENPPADNAAILANLRAAYTDWDRTTGPTIWKVAWSWLQSMGVK